MTHDVLTLSPLITQQLSTENQILPQGYRTCQSIFERVWSINDSALTALIPLGPGRDVLDQLHMIVSLHERDCSLIDIMLVLEYNAASTDPDDAQLNKRQIPSF